MKRIIMALAAMAIIGGCTEKKESNVIITQRPAEITVEEPTAINGNDTVPPVIVDWNGQQYTIRVDRQTDTSLPMATDEGGRQYYDNRFTLTILNGSNGVFLKRTFQKTDFSQHINADYLRQGAMLGLVFDCVDTNNRLRFIASVGSPDELSDNYIPLSLTITTAGTITVKRAIVLENNRTNSNRPTKQDDEGV